MDFTGLLAYGFIVFQMQARVSSSERQIKFERAQKCLENAALVSKRIKEHRKATAELLGRPFGKYIKLPEYLDYKVKS